MSNKIAFMCGLPRSGSTLLANLLNQHPELSVTGTSGLIDLVDQIGRHFAFNPAQKASNSGNYDKTLKAAIESYHNQDSNIIIDKNRGWPTHLHAISRLYNDPIYVIVCLRDVRDIIASLESLYSKRTMPWPDEINLPLAYCNIDSRIDLWLGSGGIIGNPLRRLQELPRLNNIKLHYIGYKVLQNEPTEICNVIFNDLQLSEFTVNTINFEQTVTEDDSIWGLGDSLHKIDVSGINVRPSRWKEIIGERFEHLEKYNFWSQ